MRDTSDPNSAAGLLLFVVEARSPVSGREPYPARLTHSANSTSTHTNGDAGTTAVTSAPNPTIALEVLMAPLPCPLVRGRPYRLLCHVILLIG